MSLSLADKTRLNNTHIADGRNGRFEGLPDDQTVWGSYNDTGIWGEDVTALFSSYGTQTGGTYVDIGANIGLTLIPQAKSGRFQKLIAVEADPLNAALLQRNLNHNDCPPVTVINKAISDHEGVLEFERAHDNFGDHRLRGMNENAATLMDEGAREVISIPTAPLDSLLNADDLPKPLYIKSDIQGAEPLLFKGGEKLLKQTDMMLIEYWPYGMTRLGLDIAAFQTHVASLFHKSAIIWPHKPTDAPDWQDTQSVFAEANHIFASGDTELHKIGCLNIALRN